MNKTKKIAVIICVVLILLLLFLGIKFGQKVDKSTESKSSVFSEVASHESLKLVDDDGSYNIPYRLFVPDGYEKMQPLPVVLFLHGIDENGTDSEHVNVNNDLLVNLTENFYSQFPAIIIAPQAPLYFAWGPGLLTAIIDEIERIQDKYGADKNRLYVTGQSMGGNGVWLMLAMFPDKIAAAVPLSAGGDSEQVEKFKHVPIWVFHGADDDICPPEQSLIIVNALKNVGGNVKYTEFPSVGHESWVQAYAKKELYEWMFSQRLN